MRRNAWFLALAGVVAFAVAPRLVLARANGSVPSDLMGAYCILDKVVLEPAENPVTAQLWGACAIANTDNGTSSPPPAGISTTRSSREPPAREQGTDRPRRMERPEIGGRHR